MNSPILKLALQNFKWTVNEVFAISATSSTYTIMYPTSTHKKWVINMHVPYKNGFNMGEMMTGVKKYSDKYVCEKIRGVSETISLHWQGNDTRRMGPM